MENEFNFEYLNGLQFSFVYKVEVPEKSYTTFCFQRIAVVGTFAYSMLRIPETRGYVKVRWVTFYHWSHGHACKTNIYVQGVSKKLLNTVAEPFVSLVSSWRSPATIKWKQLCMTWISWQNDRVSLVIMSWKFWRKETQTRSSLLFFETNCGIEIDATKTFSEIFHGIGGI